MSFLYLLRLLLRLLTSRGGVLAQTPLCFLLSLQTGPQSTSYREGATAQASVGRAQASFLQEVLLKQEKELCVVWTLPSTTKQLSQERFLGYWFNGVCLFHCVLSVVKTWRGALTIWGHSGVIWGLDYRSPESSVNHLFSKWWCFSDVK